MNTLRKPNNNTKTNTNNELKKNTLVIPNGLLTNIDITQNHNKKISDPSTNLLGVIFSRRKRAPL